MRRSFVICLFIGPCILLRQPELCSAAHLEQAFAACASSKTICLRVTQDFGTAAKVRLPVEEAVRELLGYAGLTAVSLETAKCACEMRMELRGKASTATYGPQGLVAGGQLHYSGADISGDITLTAPGAPPFERIFYGHVKPPERISADSFLTEEQAPFEEAWRDGSFTEEVLDAVAAISGTGPVLLAMKNPDRRVHRPAGAVLRRIGGAGAVVPLLAMLKDSDASVRANVALTLAELKDVRAVEPLIALLKDTDRSVAVQTVRALGQLGDTRAVAPLAAALKDANPVLREEAARALGKIADSRAVLPLLEAMRDTNPEVIKAAALSLIDINHPSATEHLIGLLRDERAEVRAEAARALFNSHDFRAVPGLLSLLKEPDYETRRNARTTLLRLADQIRPGDPLVQDLVASLADTDTQVREPIVIMLGKIKDPRGIQPLIGAFKDNQVTMDARSSLVAIGAPAVEPLIAALASGDVATRFGAASVLGNLKDARAVAPLAAALGDEDFGVRQNAAQALRILADFIKPGDPVVLSLIAALKDTDGWVRTHATATLGKIKDGRAVAPLVAALKDKADDADAALQELGGLTVEPLHAALRDGDPKVRERAADILGKIKDRRSVDPLITALRDNDKSVRYAVAGALGQIADSRVVPPLIAALRDPEPIVSDEAQYSLARLGNLAFDLLIATLQHKDPTLRGLAIETLGLIGDLRAVPPLINALKDRNDFLRSDAAKALKEITKQDFGWDFAKWSRWWEENKKRSHQTPSSPRTDNVIL